MKKIIFNSCKLLIPFIGIFALAISCSDIEDDDFFTEGGSVMFYQNIAPGFYDLGDIDNTSVGFDVGVGGDAISSGDVTLSYAGAAGAAGPVSLGSLSLPGTQTLSLVDACSALGINTGDVAIGDSFTFTTSAGNASRSLSVSASCSSALAGTYAFSTADFFCEGDAQTGMVTITEAAAGLYTLDDWAFGTYQHCYGGPANGWGSLELSDVCNKLSILGIDGYMDSWSFTNVQVNGSDLVLSWTNTYGEFGVTTLTREDGEWPPLTF